MTTDRVRALYDLQERRNARLAARRMETAHTIRQVDTTGGRSFVIYSDLRGLDEAAMNRVIDEEIAFFRGRGLDFEWKVYQHDAPIDLRERLAARGADVEETEALMIRELADAPARLFDFRGHNVERITDPDRVEGVVAVESAVWGTDTRGLGERLRRAITETPDEMSVYLVCMQDVPVGAAWVTYTPDSDFASLWGGSVLENYRGRGIYGALLAARAEEARQRGRRYLMIDAGPMSKPIVENLGFMRISESNPCVFTASTV